MAISGITLMEIAQLSHRKRIEFPAGLESFLVEVERASPSCQSRGTLPCKRSNCRQTFQKTPLID